MTTSKANALVAALFSFAFAGCDNSPGAAPSLTPCRGASCEAECPSGFARVGDEPCTATCAAHAACGARQHCEDSSLPAACVCDIGYRGADCSACAPGFVAGSDGTCAADASGSILAAGSLGSSSVLFGIDRSTGIARALRSLGTDPLASPIDGLALDPTSHAVFVSTAEATGERVSRLDLASGALTPIADSSSQTTLGPALLFDTATGQVDCVGGVAKLVHVDPKTGQLSVGPVLGVEVVSIAYEPLSGKALAVTKDGSLARIDLETGAATTVHLASAPVNPHYTGIAIDPSTDHVFLARERDDGLRQVARRVAIDLGHPEQATAEPTIVRTGYSPTVRSQLASGPELVFVSHEASETERSRITVDVQNPDAGVVIWNRTPAEIVIGKDARPAFVAVYSDLPSGSPLADTLVVEGGSQQPSLPFVHVAPLAKGALDPSWSAAPDFVRSYTARTWADRRLPPSPSKLDYERIDGALDEYEATLSFVRTRLYDAPLFGPVAVFPQ